MTPRAEEFARLVDINMVWMRTAKTLREEVEAGRDLVAVMDDPTVPVEAKAKLLGLLLDDEREIPVPVGHIIFLAANTRHRGSWMTFLYFLAGVDEEAFVTVFTLTVDAETQQWFQRAHPERLPAVLALPVP